MICSAICLILHSYLRNTINFQTKNICFLHLIFEYEVSLNLRAIMISVLFCWELDKLLKDIGRWYLFKNNSIVSNRQQLRESSEELKTLEAQLRAAYVSKELAAQIAEKKAAAIQEKVSFNLFNGSWQLLNLEILELETFKLKHLHQCFYWNICRYY